MIAGNLRRCTPLANPHVQKYAPVCLRSCASHLTRADTSRVRLRENHRRFPYQKRPLYRVSARTTLK